MQTTVTLDPDTEQIIQKHMEERGMTFKEVLNDIIRSSASDSIPFQTETTSIGKSAVNLDRALQVVAGLEDDDLVRKMTGS